MARKDSGFSARFPHFGKFLVIAVALAIPLTVWSMNNVSTQTQQNAAVTNPTSPVILCGSPKYYCPSGYTCGNCTGANPINQPTTDPATMCRCIPNVTPTPTPIPVPPGCYYQRVVCPAIACIKGQRCPTCPPPKLICPKPTPTVCNTNSDCQNGATCMTVGPIIANQPVRKVCVPPGQAVPL